MNQRLFYDIFVDKSDPDETPYKSGLLNNNLQVDLVGWESCDLCNYSRNFVFTMHVFTFGIQDDIKTNPNRDALKDKNWFKELKSLKTHYHHFLHRKDQRMLLRVSEHGYERGQDGKVRCRFGHLPPNLSGSIEGYYLIPYYDREILVHEYRRSENRREHGNITVQFQRKEIQDDLDLFRTTIITKWVPLFQ